MKAAEKRKVAKAINTIAEIINFASVDVHADFVTARINYDNHKSDNDERKNKQRLQHVKQLNWKMKEIELLKVMLEDFTNAFHDTF
jgi:hypothetical protein